jgi:hypothetical protein
MAVPIRLRDGCEITGYFGAPLLEVRRGTCGNGSSRRRLGLGIGQTITRAACYCSQEKGHTGLRPINPLKYFSNLPRHAANQGFRFRLRPLIKVRLRNPRYSYTCGPFLAVVKARLRVAAYA